MKKLRLTKVIAGALVVASVLALNPIGASASWKKDNTGWWYTENNSWATGWRIINGNWYYFSSNGYMAHNTVVDNYYINSDGSGVALKNSDIPIKMPQDWSKAKENTYVNNKTAIGYSKKDTNGYNDDAVISAIKQGFNNETEISELKTTEKKYHGYTATCFEFNMKINSVTMKGYSVVFIKDKVAHAFIMASESDNYNKNKQQFEDLLNLTLSL